MVVQPECQTPSRECEVLVFDLVNLTLCPRIVSLSFTFRLAILRKALRSVCIHKSALLLLTTSDIINVVPCHSLTMASLMASITVIGGSAMPSKPHHGLQPVLGLSA